MGEPEDSCLEINLSIDKSVKRKKSFKNRDIGERVGWTLMVRTSAMFLADAYGRRNVGQKANNFFLMRIHTKVLIPSSFFRNIKRTDILKKNFGGKNYHRI